MSEQYFQIFLKLTETFIFSDTSQQADADCNEKLHSQRLLELIHQVQRMAKRKYYQMPVGVQSGHELDDWVQEAVVTMFECCRKYDNKRPFDHYVRFIVSRRLTDIQRKAFRHNPPTNQAIFSLFQELKRELKREPTAVELAEYTGRQQEEIENLLENGFGSRVVVDGLDIENHTGSGNIQWPHCDVGSSNAGQSDIYSSSSWSGTSAESNCIRQEARKVLWECLDDILPEDRMLYLQHEFNNDSFAQLYGELNITKMSLATFKRRYQTDIFDPVKDCVVSRYQLQG